MSATKNNSNFLFEDQFQSDDSYEDYSRMEKEHNQNLELDLLELEVQSQGSSISRNSDWRNNEINFFTTAIKTYDLPF